ncbi:MAG: hypothetical protein CMP13_09680 [Zunongwangia sp.]|uniref:Uncharacterized protein n=4 Tax=Zunongwangia profunda TaxID=398743 RepID=D5BF94_ZUNPS|nr:hypothetical protein [Zunongwangia profunda]ADF52992.1 hypothetical protein ZPR_2670 [Zunongwangia profunda SM-A87]MAS70878.1 hypothetical protein [Zunongwangia sp.]HCV79689.1 hypothetical protein [Zunongwangia profunda]|tara:strand:- start:3213 stop:4016 length:804 start_codon:yes stop_codon:yes gene_type:complete
MIKDLNFNTAYDFEVKKETVGGLLFRLDAKASDGNGGLKSATVSDLNKISIDVILKKSNRKEVVMMRGYLMDNILGMYAQTTKYALVTKQTSEGILVFFDFNPAAIALHGEDVLQIKFNAPRDAWADIRTTDSIIEFQTVTKKIGTNWVPVVKSFPIGLSKESIDMDLGNRVVKIVCITDFTTDYLKSTKAKIRDGSLKASGNFEKVFNATQLLTENMHMFDNNPESDVEDLVIYQGEPLDDVKLRANLDKAAEEKAKVVVVALENI